MKERIEQRHNINMICTPPTERRSSKFRANLGSGETLVPGGLRFIREL
jgi:hypothetical protein